MFWPAAAVAGSLIPVYLGDEIGEDVFSDGVVAFDSRQQQQLQHNQCNLDLVGHLASLQPCEVPGIDGGGSLTLNRRWRPPSTSTCGPKDSPKSTALTRASRSVASTLLIMQATKTDLPDPVAPTVMASGEGLAPRSKRSRPRSRPIGVEQIMCGRLAPSHEDSAGMRAARLPATSVISLPVGLESASPTSSLG